MVLLACWGRNRVNRCRLHQYLRFWKQGCWSVWIMDKVHCAIMNPLLSPPRWTRKSGKLEVLPLMYLWILLSLKRATLNKAIPMKSDALATYSPWKLPAEISLSSSNPSEYLSNYLLSQRLKGYRLHCSSLRWWADCSIGWLTYCLPLIHKHWVLNGIGCCCVNPAFCDCAEEMVFSQNTSKYPWEYWRDLGLRSNKFLYHLFQKYYVQAQIFRLKKHKQSKLITTEFQNRQKLLK